MEQSPCASPPREEPYFYLRESASRARISRDNTFSRRFSGSHITCFREETKSFRSCISISSTSSSPGYSLKEEIDPSTYTFTAALKALQARAQYNSWECLSPDGFALNSKWNEAEKYICNPLSGEVPMECLSVKTLSGRSFRSSTNRITMSAPLVYSSHSKKVHKEPVIATPDDSVLPLQEKKMEARTRDVGTQSTPPDLSSGSPSPASTPPIRERILKIFEAGGDSPNCNGKLRAEGKEEEEKETRRGKEESEKEKMRKEKGKTRRCCSSTQGGCFLLSWMRNTQKEEYLYP